MAYGVIRFFMSKSLLSSSRTIGKNPETVELSKLVDATQGEIARLKDKLKRFYVPLPWLIEEQKEKIQTVHKAFKAWEDEHNPIMADLKFKYEDLCRQESEAPEGPAG